MRLNYKKKNLPFYRNCFTGGFAITSRIISEILFKFVQVSLKKSMFNKTFNFFFEIRRNKCLKYYKLKRNFRRNFNRNIKNRFPQ